jgi:hypothetical protein
MPFLIDSYEISGKAYVNNSKFIDMLKVYDKDTINDEIIELLIPYLSQVEWYNEKMANVVS